jgi:hypothetical protein
MNVSEADLDALTVGTSQLMLIRLFQHPSSDWGAIARATQYLADPKGQAETTG